MNGTDQPAPILDEERIVKSEFLAQGGILLRGCVDAENTIPDVPRYQMQHGEGEQRHNQQKRNQADKSRAEKF